MNDGEVRAMTPADLEAGLTRIGKTQDHRSYAYIELNLAHKALLGLCEELKNYQHLRYVNLAGNSIAELTVLAHLPCVLQIQAKDNAVASLQLFSSQSFGCLKSLDLSGNAISVLTRVALPSLTHLNLSNNAISAVEDFGGHLALSVLELRKNQLSSLQGLSDLPSLTELYLAENRISSFNSLCNTRKLRFLHLRKNPISSLQQGTLPDLPELEYLNLRDCGLTDPTDFTALQKYEQLHTLSTQECPVSAEPTGDSRKETLVALPQLKRLNKEKVTEEEREGALGEAQERLRDKQETEVPAKESN